MDYDDITSVAWELVEYLEGKDIYLADGDYFIFSGESGSKYKCHKKMYGVAGGSNHYVLDALLAKFPDQLSVYKENPYAS